MDNKIKKWVKYLMVLYPWTFVENLAFAIYSASENLAISKTASKNKQANVHANKKRSLTTLYGIFKEESFDRNMQ
jgi:hypothetical protein